MTEQTQRYVREHLGDDRWRIETTYSESNQKELVRVRVEWEFYRHPDHDLRDSEIESARRALKALQRRIELYEQHRMKKE